MGSKYMRSSFVIDFDIGSVSFGFAVLSICNVETKDLL